MIKTVNINLGRIIFQIDEDAYDVLRTYLDSLTQYYKYQEGRDEIIADIESRLAELFSERLEKSGFQIISLGDVEEVTQIMGKPEDFDAEGEMFDEEESKASSFENFSTGRRLYRNPDEAIISGVCSGLTAYFGLKDPTWVRLGFIVLFLLSLGTVASISYILLWVILPKAETTAQKLEMRGKAVNVNSLEQKIKEEFYTASENIKEFASGKKKHASGIGSVVNGIGRIFGGLLKVVWAFVRLLFFFVGAAIIIAALVALVASLFSFIFLIPMSIKYIFSTSVLGILSLLGALLFFGIPILFLIYLPFRLFSKYRVKNNYAVPVAVGLFLIGLMLLGISTYTVNDYFSNQESFYEETILDRPFEDTIYIAVNENEEDFKRLEYDLEFKNFLSAAQRLESASDWVELDIEPSRDEQIYLERTYIAYGSSNKKAEENARSISHNVSFDYNSIVVDPFFGLGKKSKWRNQQLKLTLKVPEGMVVAVDHTTSNILDDAKNTKNANMYTVAGNRWQMSNGMLTPVDSNLSIGSNWSKRNMKRLDYANFDKVDVSGVIDVEILQGDNYEVYLRAHKKLDKHIVVEKESDVLKIRRDDKHANYSIGFLEGGSGRYGTPQLFITMPLLDKVNARGQSDVNVKNFEQSKLEINTSGQSDLIAENIEIAHVDVDMHGQSDVYVKGKSDRLVLDGSGQTYYNGKKHQLETAFVELSGQSDASLNIEKELQADLNGQSDLEYWGNPKVQHSISGQADIYQKDDVFEEDEMD